jgi:hypothetical protein
MWTPLLFTFGACVSRHEGMENGPALAFSESGPYRNVAINITRPSQSYEPQPDLYYNCNCVKVPQQRTLSNVYLEKISYLVDVGSDQIPANLRLTRQATASNFRSIDSRYVAPHE